MKKLTKKQGIIIGVIVAIILVVAIVLGIVFAGSSKDIKDKNDTKTETVTEKETDKDTNQEENENKEEDKTDTTEKDTQSDTTDDTQGNAEEPVVTKTTMYAKSNMNVRSGAGTSNSKIGSLTKGQEIVKIGEENGWSKIEFNGGIGYVKSEYLSTEKMEENTQNSQNTNNSGNNNTPSNNGTTNNNTSNNNQGSSGNNTSTPSTSGMYSKLDSASQERFAKCAEIFRGGLAGQYMTYKPTVILYFNETIQMSNSTTNGSWMYLGISGWSTNEGSAETAPTYDELPTLVKQCLETIAPQGGTDLYNKVNSLIMQYNGPRNVPSQGRVSESIPGLYVTLEKGYSGLEVFFWAE